MLPALQLLLAKETSPLSAICGVLVGQERGANFATCDGWLAAVGMGLDETADHDRVCWSLGSGCLFDVTVAVAVMPQMSELHESPGVDEAALKFSSREYAHFGEPAHVCPYRCDVQCKSYNRVQHGNMGAIAEAGFLSDRPRP